MKDLQRFSAQRLFSHDAVEKRVKREETSESRSRSFNHSRRELPPLWSRLLLVVTVERSVFRGMGEEEGDVSVSGGGSG